MSNRPQSKVTIEELYVLDDLFYRKMVEDLRTRPVGPKAAYSHLIRFLELWGVRRTAVRMDPGELSRKIGELRPEMNRLKSLLEMDVDGRADPPVELSRRYGGKPVTKLMTSTIGSRPGHGSAGSNPT